MFVRALRFLCIIDKAINWNFIYELVESKYSQETGRSCMSPAMLIKILSCILEECYKFKLIDLSEVL